MRLDAAALALVLPTAVMAQQLNSADPMTSPVTPRDVTWYMSHPGVLEQTLQACHSNAAYGPTADCQNAERAGLGLLSQQKQKDAKRLSGAFYDPTFWDSNPIMRATILTQCRRRGPGDEIAYPFCQVAAASQLRTLNR
jgi:hypothetical protein